jgi:hypothetical protein
MYASLLSSNVRAHNAQIVLAIIDAILGKEADFKKSRLKTRVARFIVMQYTKTGKIYLTTTKLPKRK